VKNLFDRATAAEVAQRIERMTPSATRLWGKMTAPQALAHCAVAMEWAVGDRTPPRMFLGRLFGGLVKKKVVGDDAPMRRNSPTAPDLVIADDRELSAEQARLAGLVDRFSSGGPAGCTSRPHSFFGRMTPDEWAVLMYKHVDHHLRQFGA
jgi:hypothetical protein